MGLCHLCKCIVIIMGVQKWDLGQWWGWIIWWWLQRGGAGGGEAVLDMKEGVVPALWEEVGEGEVDRMEEALPKMHEQYFT